MSNSVGINYSVDSNLEGEFRRHEARRHEIAQQPFAIR